VPALVVGLAGVATLGHGFAQAPQTGFANRPMASPQGFVPAEQPGLAGPAPGTPTPHPFEVTAQAGPWMVLAATYTSPRGSPDALYMAEQVVRYLRGKGYAAYLWSFSDQKRRQEEEEYNRMMQANPELPYRRRITRMQEQCGVLVGGFRDSEAANKELKKIKGLPAPVVRNRAGEVVADKIVRPNEGEASLQPRRVDPFAPGGAPRHDLHYEAISPFVRAFVIRNPTIPHQQVDQTAKVDPLWKKLNAREEYSLLRCRKDWTLVIKVYEGAGALESRATQTGGNSFLDVLGFGDRSHKILDATAAQAHELARFLRASMRLETYVLHTRSASIVTVGSFDRPDDEQLKSMQRQLSGGRLRGTGQAHELFAQPMPMRVPRL
jgi:hypothetical protein